jgi:aldehyde decarbonylase
MCNSFHDCYLKLILLIQWLVYSLHNGELLVQEKFNPYHTVLFLYKFLQGELNKNGNLYIQKYPQLRIKLVVGSSLAVAVVLNNIPKGITQVFLSDNCQCLCERDIQVRFNC